MMQTLDLIHRWTGGLIGLLLGLLGLSGALLVHKDDWLRWTLPHAAQAQRNDTASVVVAVETLMAAPERPASILFSTERFGLHRIYYEGGAGAYADQAGAIVTRWNSVWDRPELWLFDFHHYLLMGDAGETIAGIAGLIGLGFVVTGVILWWRMRKSFAFRLWPKRMTRPSIVRHHRDLGVVLAPLLTLSMLTGTMLVLRPVANLVLSPITAPGEIEAGLAPPGIEGGAFDARAVDWAALIGEARRRFPGTELRVLSVPSKPGRLISLRTRQPAEWLPQGRSTLWFDPADGRLIEARDALKLPSGSQAFNLLYPLHAAKVGGLAYRLAMTASGLALAMLGSFAVWSFWTERGRRWRSEARRRRLSTAAAPAE